MTDRQYHPFKPEVDHLPISSWAQNAYNSILKALGSNLLPYSETWLT